MTAQIVPIRANLEVAWQAYVDAVRKHQETLDINDGIATGRAYRRWLDIFLSDEQRSKLGALR